MKFQKWQGIMLSLFNENFRYNPSYINGNKNTIIAEYKCNTVDETIQLLGEDFDTSQIQTMVIEDIGEFKAPIKQIRIKHCVRIFFRLRSSYNSLKNMFNGCANLFKIDLLLDAHEVTGMAYMFYNCMTLEKFGALVFNTDKLRYTNNMFDGCASLKLIDMSTFNLSKIENANKMFAFCNSLKVLRFDGEFNKDASVKSIFGNNYFDKNNRNGIISCPFSYKDSYESIIKNLPSNWKVSYIK